MILNCLMKLNFLMVQNNAKFQLNQSIKILVKLSIKLKSQKKPNLYNTLHFMNRTIQQFLSKLSLLNCKRWRLNINERF